MRRDFARAARFLLLPTVGLVVVAAFVPGRLTLAARIFALAVCAAALGLVLGELRRRYPRARPLRPAQPTRGEQRRPPGSLARIEDEVTLGVAGAFDLHYRLVPRLRALASGLLASRRRVSLDASPDASRALLGETTWELVRSDRRPPDDRLARGITPADLSGVVDALERV